MSGKGTWILIAGTLLGCVAALVAIIGFVEKNMGLGALGAGLVLAAIVGTVLLYRGAGKAGRPEFERALASDFTASESGWYHSSGIAIDHGRRMLLLGTARGTRRVGFDRLGPVTYQRTKTGPMVGGNSILALITVPMAISTMIHNATRAGLHVVADGSSVRIIGMQPRDAERWQARLEAARAGTDEGSRSIVTSR